MKFCYACGRTTAGKPLFCNFCGRSYDVKYCPRHHLNPRYAEACSRCGNRNLSLPQPRVPFLWRAAVVAAQLVIGLLLAFASYALLVVAFETTSQVPPIRHVIVLTPVISILAWLFSAVPDWLRTAICRLLKKRDRGNGS